MYFMASSLLVVAWKTNGRPRNGQLPRNAPRTRRPGATPRAAAGRRAAPAPAERGLRAARRRAGPVGAARPVLVGPVAQRRDARTGGVEQAAGRPARRR